MTSGAHDTAAPDVMKFGRYIAHRLIGEGGMGKVYLAQDPVLDRVVAIKVIVLDMNLDETTRSEYLSRFTLEAKASAKLNHPSIISVYDAGEEEGVPWIAFEFVDGERLDRLLKHVKNLPVNEAVSIALDIASALQHAHSHGIIHRDIKPSNILIERNTGIAKLADFGIVKAPWTVVTRQGDVVGSPGYMSPEQINGFELDGRTDLFSLGVVFYEMIAGKHPFLRDTVHSTLLATLGAKHSPLSEVCPSVPSTVTSVIDTCIISDRDKRIQTAEELTRLLTSHPSHSYQSPRSREALGGMTKKIARALTDGTLQSHTRHLIHTRFEGIRKFFRFLTELITDCYQILVSLISSVIHRLLPRKQSPSLAETQTIARPASAQKGGWGLGTILTVPVRTFSKLRAHITTFSPLTWIVVTVIIVSMIGMLIPSIWFITSNNKKNILMKKISKGSLAESLAAAQELDRQGIDWPLSLLVNRCRDLLDHDNIELAAMAAQKITELEPALPQGHILVGRVALKSGEYDKARESFLLVKKQKNGKEALKQAHIRILADLSQELMRGKAKESLITMASAVLTPEDEPLIRSWLESENYWLRWNSVKLLEAGNRLVDMVDIYIFDLKYSADIKTRIYAAKKLGELRDNRAIPSLQESARNQKSDPKVARIAKAVLDEYYR